MAVDRVRSFAERNSGRLSCRPREPAGRREPADPRTACRRLARRGAHPRRHDLEARRMTVVAGMRPGARALAAARGDARRLRLGYWSLVAVGLPGWVAMWVGANWIYAREDLDEEPIASVWVGIGFVVAELGLLLFLLSLVLGGIGIYRLRAGKGTGLLQATSVLSIVLLCAYV